MINETQKYPKNKKQFDETFDSVFKKSPQVTKKKSVKYFSHNAIPLNVRYL